MTFRLSSRSLNNLKGVHPNLVNLVKEAITITPIDFGILNNGGLRTASMQNSLYKRGASKLDGYNRISKHQRQRDGWGHAVDLVPYHEGSYRWEWPLIYPIAGCMAFLSQKHDVPLRWGGVWDQRMEKYIPSSGARASDLASYMKQAVYDYTVRHPGPDFIDGPHYELR